MQRLLCFLLAMVSATTLFAVNGIVWTLDGRKLQGDIELSPNTILIKQISGDDLALSVTNLARAEFSNNVVAAPSKGSGNGLLGIYYDTTNCAGTAVMRLDRAVNFDWHEEPPILGVPKDYFSVRWMGQLEAPVTDIYTIYFGSDEGGRIYVDEQLVADHWTRHEYAETNVMLNLKAGEKHKLKIDYFDFLGNGRAQLWWSTPSLPKTIIPQGRLYAASFEAENRADTSGLVGAQGLLGTYYNSDDFTSNSFTRLDSEINFDWQGESPAEGIDSKRFSVRWSGNLLVPSDGDYKFYLISGVPARFFLNGQLLSDPMDVTPQQIITTTLRAADPCELRLELQVTNNIAPVRLYWSGDTFPKSLISRQHFSPASASTNDAPRDNGPSFPAGVILLSGAIVGAPIQSANETSIRFQGLLARATLPLTKVARIYVKPMTAEFAAALPKGRAGVLLKNRDFIDGDLAAIEDGKLKLASMLFGTRSYDLAKDVVAIVLRGNEPAPWRCSITARDGTALYGSSLLVETARLAMSGAAEFSIEAPEVLEISRRVGEREPR